VYRARAKLKKIQNAANDIVHLDQCSGKLLFCKKTAIMVGAVWLAAGSTVPYAHVLDEEAAQAMQNLGSKLPESCFERAKLERVIC
jgi:hypothetical protein